MDVAPSYHEFKFVEELGRDLLDSVKGISQDIRPLNWIGHQGITNGTSSLWNGMRSIMKSKRKYS